MAKLSQKISPAVLAEIIGIPVPHSFVRAIALVHASTSEQRLRFEFLADPWSFLLPRQLTEIPLNSRRLRQELRYSCTPAEVFPFATMGVDGVHYGFVVHDPSMRLPGSDPHDWPIAHVSPMDFDDTCSYIGRTFVDALCRGVTQIRDFGFDEQTEARARSQADRVLNALGVPAPEKSIRARSFSVPKKNAVHVPPDWLLATTLDRLGVLAPKSHFRSRRAPPANEELTTAEQIDLATTDLSDGFAATALVRLRDAWLNDWVQDDVASVLSPLLVDTYEALGRQALAEAVTLRERVRRKSRLR